MATATATLPPTTENADKTQEALKMRRDFLKKLNEKLTPALRKWVIDSLANDIEAANG